MSAIHHFCGTESAWDWENVFEYPIKPGDERTKGVSANTRQVRMTWFISPPGKSTGWRQREMNRWVSFA